MQIGIIGLGKMGKNMALRLSKAEHDVVGFDVNEKAVIELAEYGVNAASSIEDLLSKLNAPKIIWLMLPAGEITEDSVTKLLPLLNPEDIVIDGGNAFYRDSIRRAKVFQEKNIHFLDIGVSGGVWGLEEGYCLMAGGDKKAYDKVEPLLKSLAPEKGLAYIGGSGSGHFVKMVHNGIEYAMLQAYGEGFDIIHAKSELNIDLEALSDLWNHGSVIRSWLLELAKDAFHDERDLASIAGYVEDSGEGRWTVMEAIESGVPAPTITLSLIERLHSRRKESFSAKVIAALRNKFGGHKVRN